MNKVLSIACALAINAIIATPAFAAAPGFLLDFERNWDYGSDVAEYYNGGTAYNVGSPLVGVTGNNYGVSFTSDNSSALLGISNDAFFNYYNNAPSTLGTASPFGTVFMNVAAGVDSFLSFYYASPDAVIGAVKAYSGLNGTGTLLGSFDLQANNPLATYDTWTKVNFQFTGTALSFDFSASSSVVGFDNISNISSPVPEADSYALMLAGLGLMGFVVKRRK